MLKLLVERQSPGAAEAGGFVQEYHLELSKPMVLLEVLKQIQVQIDPSLAFRDYCCSHGPACGACLVSVGGKNVYACSYRVELNQTLTVGPAKGWRVVRDLVTDFTKG